MSTGTAIDHINHRCRTAIDLRRLQLRPSRSNTWAAAGTAKNLRDQGTNFGSAGQLNSLHISSSSGLTLIRARDLRFNDERLPHYAIQALGSNRRKTRRALAKWTIRGRSNNELSHFSAKL